MNRKMMFGSVFAVCTLAVVVGSIAVAEDKKPAGAPPEMKLPPGWTQEDMMACAKAATPGDQQKLLAKSLGTWEGKSQMWMPGSADPMNSTCTAVISSMMDGRYVKVDWTGDMPGMGPFNGFGINGFDNSAGKFVSIWVDSMSTGIMNGTGEASADGKTFTWNYNYTCPVTKKPAVMRQIEKMTGENTKTLEMFGNDPKSGKEYKMMSIELTRK